MLEDINKKSYTESALFDFYSHPNFKKKLDSIYLGERSKWRNGVQCSNLSWPLVNENVRSPTRRWLYHRNSFILYNSRDIRYANEASQRSWRQHTQLIGNFLMSFILTLPSEARLFDKFTSLYSNTILSRHCSRYVPGERPMCWCYSWCWWRCRLEETNAKNALVGSVRTDPKFIVANLQTEITADKHLEYIIGLGCHNLAEFKMN